MAVKLHTCSMTWLKGNWHPCDKVRKALDDAGIDYERVKHPAIGKGRRKEYVELTGGVAELPAIEREDGTVVREESDDLVAQIKAGKLP